MNDESNCSSVVYEDLFDLLTLKEEHRKTLEDRGFSEDEITQGGWKSIPASTKDIVAKLYEIHAETLKGVAGFYMQDGKTWSLNASNCLAIPIRTPEGLIAGVKIRTDAKNAAKKYWLLTSGNASGNSNDTCGSKAKPSPHFPVFTPDNAQEGVLRITEGEFKADIATLHSEIYTCSIPGVGFWKTVLPHIRETQPQKIVLAFDSDKSDVHSTSIDSEEEYKVGKELSKLYNALKAENFNVWIEDWDGGLGKGIDDVLVAGFEEDIQELSDEAAELFCSEKLSGTLEDDWVYIIQRKQFLSTKDGLQYDKEQYDDVMLSLTEEKGKPSTNFLKDPSSKKFHQIVYKPGFPEVVTFQGSECYNSWKPFPLASVDGDPQPFLDHISYLMPNPKESKIILDFLAWQVQNPGKKMAWALLVQGKQGSGKSYLGYVLKKILGEENVGFPSNEAIKGIYNKWQCGHSAIVIEEIMTTGRMDVMNRLKPMITEEVATVREMRKDEYTVPNVYNLMAFTNHKDAIRLEGDDRRYCVLFSAAAPRTSTYYSELFNWTKDNAGVVKKFLMDRDMSRFNPKSRAPETDAKKELIGLSLSVWEEFILDRVESLETPFVNDIICPSDITHYLNKRFSLRLGTRAVTNKLIDMGFTILGQYNVNRTKKRLMAVRNGMDWKDAEKELIIKNFSDVMDCYEDPWKNDNKERIDTRGRQQM